MLNKSCLVMVFVACAACSGENPATASLELRVHEPFLRVGGVPAFVFGRNPTGANVNAFKDHFEKMHAAGECFARIHFTFMPPGEKPGEVARGMFDFWDAVLDAAEKNGVGVLPVLGVWADWNDGSRKENWHTWDKNPFNTALGGPAKSPAELLEDTACQRLWFQRLDLIVKRWAPRTGIVGWEIFSEIDLITGSAEPRAVEFATRAAAIVRTADAAKKRPVTISQAGNNEWPKLLASDALDFIEVHPYPGSHSAITLDESILAAVYSRIKAYGKPVLIGESGCDAAPPRNTNDTLPRAEIGLRHAIWAGVVSGAMSGRMFWWQDGYDYWEKADLCSRCQKLSEPAVAFVRGVDFTDFRRIGCEVSGNLKGACIGHDKTRLAWFRDSRCTAPNWPDNPLPGQFVTMPADGTWHIEYVDPETGKSLGKQIVESKEKRLRIDVPEFRSSIALKLVRSDG